ncbi:hypothetical protein V3C99_006982 [Haemonchus contortus]
MKHRTGTLICLVVIIFTVIGISVYRSIRLPSPDVMITAKGYVTMDELDLEVFAPHGFRLMGETDTILLLDFIQKPTCEEVFDEWLKIALANDQYRVPPKIIPPSLAKKYLMNGHAHLIEEYRSDRPEGQEHVWSQIPKWLEMPEDELYKISLYGKPGMAVYHAFMLHPLNGKVGFVIGSQTPWVEVFALLNGAKTVTTVEYQHLKINGTEKVRYMHPIEFAKNWRKYKGSFDFAASFSSVEHSGLGRYGDPMDPIGDLREVWKTSCLLKKGGLFFLGLPRGSDTVVFNLHRIYGPLRLAMVMTGYELVATFRDDSPVPASLDRSHFDLGRGQFVQDLFVLRKL